MDTLSWQKSTKAVRTPAEQQAELMMRATAD